MMPQLGDIDLNEIEAILLSGVWYDVFAVEERDAHTISFLPNLTKEILGKPLRVICAKADVAAVGVNAYLGTIDDEEAGTNA